MVTMAKDDTPDLTVSGDGLNVGPVDTLKEVADHIAWQAELDGTPRAISIRVQPQLYDSVSRKMVGWRGLFFTVDVRDYQTGVEYRRTLQAFFKALPKIGLRRTREALEAAIGGQEEAKA
jgi:hypothetical protein